MSSISRLAAVLDPVALWAAGDPPLRFEVGDACCRSAADVRDKTGLTALGDNVSEGSLLIGDAPLLSSPVSCPLPSLAFPLPNWLPIDPTRSPGRNLGLGAESDIRPLVALAGGADVRFPILGPPASDGLDVRAAAGGGGGPIEVLPPPTLGLGFDSVTEGFLALEGVPVRGVEAFDVVAESCFVGDFVGDCKMVKPEFQT
jgi:hypothetical protein